MSDHDWTKALRKKAPKMAQDFDRASKPAGEKEEKPSAQLNFDPPELVPGGGDRAPRPLVSPQLRERIEKAQALKKSLQRAFRDAASRGVER